MPKWNYLLIINIKILFKLGKGFGRAPNFQNEGQKNIK